MRGRETNFERNLIAFHFVYIYPLVLAFNIILCAYAFLYIFNTQYVSMNSKLSRQAKYYGAVYVYMEFTACVRVWLQKYVVQKSVFVFFSRSASVSSSYKVDFGDMAWHVPLKLSTNSKKVSYLKYNCSAFSWCCCLSFVCLLKVLQKCVLVVVVVELKY